MTIVQFLSLDQSIRTLRALKNVVPFFVAHAVIGEREVRAVVKLKFKDIMKNMVTCHRMLASIQKV